MNADQQDIGAFRRAVCPSRPLWLTFVYCITVATCVSLVCGIIGFCLSVPTDLGRALTKVSLSLIWLGMALAGPICLIHRHLRFLHVAADTLDRGCLLENRPPLGTDDRIGVDTEVGFASLARILGTKAASIACLVALVFVSAVALVNDNEFREYKRDMGGKARLASAHSLFVKEEYEEAGLAYKTLIQNGLETREAELGLSRCVTRLREQAERQIAENRLTRPASDCALTTVQSIARIDPHNRAITSLKDRLGDTYIEWAITRQSRGDLAGAKRHLARAVKAGLTHDQINARLSERGVEELLIEDR